MAASPASSTWRNTSTSRQCGSRRVRGPSLNLSPLFRGERSEQREAMLRVRGKAMRGNNGKTIRIARRLRANQTDAETVLWNRIRNRQIDEHKFARQVPIGPYICDFVCRERQVVIEVDGGQHNESTDDVVR